MNTSSLAGQTLYQAKPLQQNLVGKSGFRRSTEVPEQQAEVNGDVPPPPLQIVISTPSFSIFSFLISL